jgi:hypothetical protein
MPRIRFKCHLLFFVGFDSLLHPRTRALRVQIGPLLKRSHGGSPGIIILFIAIISIIIRYQEINTIKRRSLDAESCCLSSRLRHRRLRSARLILKHLIITLSMIKNENEKHEIARNRMSRTEMRSVRGQASKSGAYDRNISILIIQEENRSDRW